MVSVIIVNYNCYNLTIQAVNSLIEKTKDVNYEIIIVDNNSTDNSVSELNNILDSNIRLIENHTNAGFGAANNIGIKASNGSYLFLLNPDTIFINNALDILYSFYKKNEKKLKLGVIGAQLYDANFNKNITYGIFPKLRSLLIEKPAPSLETNVDYIKVDYINGADMFLKKTIVERCGCFDEDFFMYFEETELQKRISKYSLSQYVVPAAKIIHLDGGTFQKVKKRSSFRRYYYDVSKIKYAKKQFTEANYLIFRLLFLLFRLPSVLNYHYNIKDNYKHFLLLISKF